ncbi:MAG TPA: 50S ribosomal protein L21 [Candidatus Limnocylindrales bacterium]|jgi:large subunit ribosomal protein L21
MYAVIETGGKQYHVEVGTELAVELLDVEPGQEITLDRVLLVADGDEAAIGRPLVAGAVVSATVLRADRADKVISFKYKPKARRRVKKGHRQEQTILRVTDVVLNGKSAAETEKVAAEARKTERERLAEAAATQATADAALAATLATKAAAADAADASADAAKKPAKAAKAASAPATGKAKPAAAKGKTPAPDTAKPAAKRPRAAKKED